VKDRRGDGVSKVSDMIAHGVSKKTKDYIGLGNDEGLKREERRMKGKMLRSAGGQQCCGYGKEGKAILSRALDSITGQGSKRGKRCQQQH